MKVTEMNLPGILLIEPEVYEDSRGFFLETWNQKRFLDRGLPNEFVQDNVSFSRKGVLRGLHFQNPNPQGKLVSVLFGEVFDVVVDLRVDSPCFGKWLGTKLSSENREQMFIPPGFAHGFVVTSDKALFFYKCTEYYDSKTEMTLLWNDPDIGIAWPTSNPVLSRKDQNGLKFSEVPRFKLFGYPPMPAKEKLNNEGRISIPF